MLKTVGSIAKSVVVASLAIANTGIYAQSKNQNMKLTSNQAAPAFSIQDVDGKTVRLSDYKGKKILVTFYRNVGCPVCNFRFHELQKQSEYFKSKGLELLAAYESSAENMKEYLAGESFYATMIPNPDQSLYKLYGIERSMGKMMKGMFHRAMAKMKAGKKLFKKKIKQDGNSNRIGADFLIDENGIIVISYYGKYLGDHLSVEELKQFLN